ncbi:Protein disulfide-isomerase tmx3 [Dermatophagoides pteronyssinus]|uniref:Protein disulfide-isomerase tmx3 n=1 Tax=Dermatophagoides pteronyssinus TaxID=6956 RepID=A0ABQ8JN27_DERPT|nr:Protein disulfide-isomerase tmx3 [Dermatophagoides pteronyssinus]
MNPISCLIIRIMITVFKWKNVHCTMPIGFWLIFLGPFQQSLLWSNIQSVHASRVIEMNDRLVEVYPNDKRSFLIKFYAPWCHHCQDLEPVWAQVAQQLHNLDANIVVGRVDCTKYLTAASHFTIRGFPTILYINSQKQIEFKGERTRDDIIDFALRVHGPPIRYLSSCDQLNDLVQDGRRVIFINFGPEADGNFTRLAAKFQPHDWFFRSLMLCQDFQPGIYALKSKNVYAKFDYQTNGDLAAWIRRHRFPHFTRFTSTNLHMALSSHKLLAISIVEEHRSNGKLIGQKNVAFKNIMESIANEYSNKEDHFLFGYSSDLITMNSLAIRTIHPIPNLLILNSTTLKYYLLSDNFEEIGDTYQTIRANILKFLDQIINESETLIYYGGDSYIHRIIRLFFDTLTTILTMYQGNPVLTLLLLGLPSSFLAIIVYMTCCSDFLDARDDDLTDQDEQDEHEKRD